MAIKSSRIFKIIALVLCFALSFEQSSFAQVAGELDLSSRFARLTSSFTQDRFRPLHLRYISYDNLNNNFKLLLDKGDAAKSASPATATNAAKDLIKYFFVGISLPNESFWVNLRPDAEDNIIDPFLAQTDVGKILLEADLQLKKDTASFTSPQTPEGKEYWNKLYQKAGELFGNENITIPTLTRPWIVPGEIIIRETPDNAYIYKATLKVMLEQDYLKDSTSALASTYSFKDERSRVLNEYSSQLVRELIIPKLNKDVNTSKRYAPLRQVYYSLILAQWFKQGFYGKGGLYSSLINQKNLTGLTSQDPWSKTTYFQAYQKSFQEGEYNIKEQSYYLGSQTIRNYMSGGIAIGGNEIAGAIKSGGEIAGSPLRPIEALNLKGIFSAELSGGSAQDPYSGEIEVKPGGVLQAELSKTQIPIVSSPVNKEKSTREVSGPSRRNFLELVGKSVLFALMGSLGINNSEAIASKTPGNLKQKIATSLSTFGYLKETEKNNITSILSKQMGNDLLSLEMLVKQGKGYEALKRLYRLLKQKFAVDSGENPADLGEVFRKHKANCIGSAQLLRITGQAIGLEVIPIEVIQTIYGKPKFHVASLVRLGEGKVTMVDLLNEDVGVSKPFDLTESYKKDGIYLVRIPPETSLGTHKKVRILNLNGLFNYLMLFNYGLLEDVRLPPEIINNDPENVHSYLFMGSSWKKSMRGDEKADYSKAEEWYKKALEINPDFFSAHTSLARLYEDWSERLDISSINEQKSMRIKAIDYYSKAINFLLDLIPGNKRNLGKIESDSEPFIDLCEGLAQLFARRALLYKKNGDNDLAEKDKAEVRKISEYQYRELFNENQKTAGSSPVDKQQPSASPSTALRASSAVEGTGIQWEDIEQIVEGYTSQIRVIIDKYKGAQDTPEQWGEFVRAYYNFLNELAPKLNPDGSKTIIYPFMGKDKLVTLLGRVYPLTGEDEKGVGSLGKLLRNEDVQGIGKKIEENIMDKEPLDALDIKNYQKIRNREQGPYIFVMKGFVSSSEDSIQATGQLAHKIIETVLRPGDMILVLNAADALTLMSFQGLAENDEMMKQLGRPSSRLLRVKAGNQNLFIPDAILLLKKNADGSLDNIYGEVIDTTGVRAGSSPVDKQQPGASPSTAPRASSEVKADPAIIKDRIIGFVKKNGSAWVIFSDMSKLGLRDGYYAYGGQIADFIIEEAIKNAQGLFIQEKGLLGRLGDRSDEIIGAASGDFTEEEMQEKINDLQDLLGDRFRHYVFAELPDNLRREVKGKPAVKKISTVSQKGKFGVIFEAPDTAKNAKSAVSLLLGRDVQDFSAEFVLFPYLPAGAVRVSEGKVFDKAALEEALKSAEANQGVAKEDKKFAGVEGIMKPKAAELKGSLFPDQRQEESLENDLRGVREALQKTIKPIKDFISRKISDPMQAQVEGDRIRIEEEYGVFMRNNLYSILEYARNTSKAELQTYIIRGPPDNFYIIQSVNGQWQLSLVKQAIFASDDTRLKDFKRVRAGSRRQADTGQKIPLFGFKEVNDSFDHTVGNQLIKLDNYYLWKYFSEQGKLLSQEEIVNILAKTKEDISKVTTQKGFGVQLNAVVIAGKDIDSSTSTAQLLDDLHKLSDARNQQLFVRYNEDKGCSLKAYSENKTKDIWQSVESEFKTAQEKRRERAREGLMAEEVDFRLAGLMSRDQSLADTISRLSEDDFNRFKDILRRYFSGLIGGGYPVRAAYGELDKFIKTEVRKYLQSPDEFAKIASSAVVGGSEIPIQYIDLSQDTTSKEILNNLVSLISNLVEKLSTLRSSGNIKDEDIKEAAGIAKEIITTIQNEKSLNLRPIIRAIVQLGNEKGFDIDLPNKLGGLVTGADLLTYGMKFTNAQAAIDEGLNNALKALRVLSTIKQNSANIPIIRKNIDGQDVDVLDLNGIQTSESSSPVVESKDTKGGIDLRSLPIATQQVPKISGRVPLAVPLNSQLRGQSLVELKNEWQQIENMLDAGIIPSTDRIKIYLQSCCLSGSFNREANKVLSCLAQILRMDEERVVATDPALKQMLVLLESDRVTDELQLSLAKITVQEKEPIALKE